MTQDTTALLTVVVPAYKVQNYLRKCLDSLRFQTVCCHRVVVVDDGSKDATGEIGKEYAEKYPDMFAYVYQENAGQGAARNIGMKYANTQYLCFLDSDDWLLPRTVERVVNALLAEQEEPDIVFMTPEIFNMSTNLYEPWRDNERLMRIFGGQTVICPSENPEMYGLEMSICRCVWRSSFLKEHTFAFPEGIKWEDVFPHFYLFHWARRCILVCNAGFCYRINSGTQTTSLVSNARLDIVPVFASTLAYAVENGWGDAEIAYIIDTMLEFSRWSLVASTPSIQKKLAKQLHILYGAVPKCYYRVYQKELRPGWKNRFLWILLRMPVLYRLFSDSHRLERGKRIFQQLKALRRRRA